MARKGCVFMSNVMRVEGYGEMSAQPDMMRFHYDLVQDADSYSESHIQLSAQYEDLVQAFKSVMLNTALIKTSSIDVSIIHPYEDKPKQFRSSQKIIFEDRINLEKMNALLDALRASTDFNFSLSYFIKDSTKYEYDALILAINDATDKAKIMASASGVKLGSIKNIDYGSSGNMPPLMRTMSMDSHSMNAQDLKVSETVVVSWEIK